MQIIRETLVTFTTDSRSVESRSSKISTPEVPPFWLQKLKAAWLGLRPTGLSAQARVCHSSEHSIQLAPEMRAARVLAAP